MPLFDSPPMFWLFKLSVCLKYFNFFKTRFGNQKILYYWKGHKNDLTGQADRAEKIADNRQGDQAGSHQGAYYVHCDKVVGTALHQKGRGGDDQNDKRKGEKPSWFEGDSTEQHKGPDGACY